MVGALVGAILLAGCSGGAASNQAPRAQLTSDKTVRATGQDFEFDARGSSDSDGKVTAWHFEFGDGQTKDVSSSDDARLKHAYLHGGDFTATVTVSDDGNSKDGRLTNVASVKVAVNQAFALTGQVVNTTLTGANYNAAFTAYDGIDRFEVSSNVTSTLAAGSSDIQARMLDADGNVLASKTVTVSAGQSMKLDFSGPITKAGASTVEFSVKTGAASVAGQLRTYYDAVLS